MGKKTQSNNSNPVPGNLLPPLNPSQGSGGSNISSTKNTQGTNPSNQKIGQAQLGLNNVKEQSRDPPPKVFCSIKTLSDNIFVFSSNQI